MDVLSYIPIAIGIAGGLGVVSAYFYQSRAKAIIEILQSENAAKDGKITRLEADALKSEAVAKAYELRIEAYEKLPDYTKISRQITTQHKEVMVTMSGIMELLAKESHGK